MAGQKKRQPGNPPVRNPPPPKGAFQKAIKEKMKRIHKKPAIPRGR